MVIVGVLKQSADGMVGAALVLQHHARLLDVLSSGVQNVTQTDQNFARLGSFFVGIVNHAQPGALGIVL